MRTPASDRDATKGAIGFHESFALRLCRDLDGGSTEASGSHLLRNPAEREAHQRRDDLIGRGRSCSFVLDPTLVAKPPLSLDSCASPHVCVSVCEIREREKKRAASANQRTPWALRTKRADRTLAARPRQMEEGRARERRGTGSRASCARDCLPPVLPSYRANACERAMVDNKRAARGGPNTPLEAPSRLHCHRIAICLVGACCAERSAPESDSSPVPTAGASRPGICLPADEHGISARFV